MEKEDERPTQANISTPTAHISHSTPAGSIMAFAGDDEPNGWLFCDGRAISRSDYKELYQAIRNNYGRGDGRTTFNLPDLKGRVIVGIDGGSGRVTRNNDLGDSGGEENVILTTEQMPKHNHKMFDAISGSPIPPTTAVLSGMNPNKRFFGFSEDTGGDQPHNNMPPYLVLNYIIKH